MMQKGIFNSFNKLIVIFPLASCWGCLSDQGHLSNLLINTLGLNRLSPEAIDISGFMALASPEF